MPPAAATPVPDPRWSFAARVASQLEGGRAAVLRPERRDRLVRLAGNLGIRPFDAALIIAMVQDTARRGETPPGHPPLTPALADRLRALPDPAPRRSAATPILQKLAGALLIATALVAAAILWLNAPT